MKYNLLKSIAVIAAFLVGVAINHSCGESTTDDSVPPANGQELWNIIRALQTEVSTLKTEVSTLKEELSALDMDKDIATLRTEISALKEELAALNTSTDVAALKEEVSTLKEEILSLNVEPEISALKEETATLTARMTGMGGEIERLNTEVAALKSTGGGSSGNSDCGEFFVDGLYFSRNGRVLSREKQNFADDGSSRTEYYYDNQGRITKYGVISDNGFSLVYTYDYSGKTVTVTTNEVMNGQQISTSNRLYEYY
ncbi:hypothetical protein [uncultured Alistipes sp.]|uniref:hypothetical protein n=1 Tax=uncultured Alistipes sp. TaxID=538949 RepID=UPI0032203FBA